MTIDDPIFAHFPEHDAAITAWFSRNGWPVTMRHFDFERDVFAWRHEGRSGDRTIRVTQSTLEDYPADKVIALFDASRLADVLPRNPEKYVILRGQSPGGIAFEILDGPPGK
jgi:hypothetical protein